MTQEEIDALAEAMERLAIAMANMTPWIIVH